MTEDIKKILLRDNTRSDDKTQKNIIWATDDYENISATDEIQIDQIPLIKMRHEKIHELQKNRAKNKAEIFTPTWICNKQNNLIDESFDKNCWRDYIKKTILEITCGEAPYIANRYDAVTGEPIEIKNRGGMLDRKLKVIAENTISENDFLDWAKKAVQSVYGYEFQGDSLYLARKNIFLTVQDFFQDKFNFDAPPGFLYDIAEIISWNFWQMDGRKFSVPLLKQLPRQQNLFGEENYEDIPCKIFDWQENTAITFKKIVGGGDSV